MKEDLLTHAPSATALTGGAACGVYLHCHGVLRHQPPSTPGAPSGDTPLAPGTQQDGRQTPVYFLQVNHLSQVTDLRII